MIPLRERLYSSFSLISSRDDLQAGVFEPTSSLNHGDIMISPRLWYKGKQTNKNFSSDKQKFIELLKKSGLLKKDVQRIDFTSSGYINFYFFPHVWIKEFTYLLQYPPCPTIPEEFLQDFNLSSCGLHSPIYPSQLFWILYAYARTISIKAYANRLGYSSFPLAPSSLETLIQKEDFMLVKQLAFWTFQLEIALARFQPHRIAKYLYDLAAKFNTIGENRREITELGFIFPNDLPSTEARLAIVEGIRLVLQQGLKIFCISPVEELK